MKEINERVSLSYLMNDVISVVVKEKYGKMNQNKTYIVKWLFGVERGNAF